MLGLHFTSICILLVFLSIKIQFLLCFRSYILMAESSSDSDSYLRTRVSRRGPMRANHMQARSRGVVDVSEKIHTLANTLQDTSKNLRQVDKMLGHYREHNSEQTEAIASLKQNLEQSIDQLRSKRLSRLSGTRSASLSSLCASDLDAGETVPIRQQLQPTSPLKDYRDRGETWRRRRSHSANVRFVEESNNTDQLHTLHQSLRDLSSDQLRLNEDFSREFARRNRTDAETKRTLHDLTARVNDTQRQESVSERVERRLQELEREMKSERQQVEKHQDHLGHVSVQLHEALKKKESLAEEVVASLKDKLGQAEQEKMQMETELVNYRKRLDQTEGSREALLCQVEDLRTQLLKAEDDRGLLQHHVSQLSLLSQRETREEERRARTVVERTELEKKELERQILELRAQLSRSAILSEVEDLKRSLEQKNHERTQLAGHIEALTSDMEKREKQQMKMLQQLKDIQSRYENCERERQQAVDHVSELNQQLEELSQEAERYLGELRQAEALRAETERKKEELKAKAQATVKHWRLKFKKLEKEIEKQEETINQIKDSSIQVTKERDEMRSQLQATLQQTDNLRRELAEVLARRAQQEEELHLRDVRLSEAREQHLELERDLQESQETTCRLQVELEKYRALQQQMREDHEKLQEALLSSEQTQKKNKETVLELQEVVKNISAERAALSNQLAKEVKASKDLQKNLCEAQKQAEFAREELTLAGKQLKMEREVHQKELTDLRSAAQSAKGKHERSLQEMLAHFRQEREELENHICTLKAELVESKSLVKSERQRIERMKVECDKLAEEVSQSNEENGTLRSNYQLAMQDVEDKTKLQWLCEEVKEREEQNRKIHCQLQHSQGQLKEQRQKRESELEALCQQVTEQKQKLEETDQEKKELLEKIRRRDEEMWLLQDRIMDLERSTRMALDHLESVPEKLSLLDNMKDLCDSHQQREVMEERYAQYREIVGSLQQQLEDSKRRIQEYREERIKAEAHSARLASLSSSLRAQNSTLSSSLYSDYSSSLKERLKHSDFLGDHTQFITMNGKAS
uniref:Centrosomal protein 128kDa n=1 Tax=Xenopus tropicalis TaxID=8364 RepID=A0A6I8PW15_XENTR